MVSLSIIAAGLSAGEIALVCVCALGLAAVLCGIYWYHQHKMLKRAKQGGTCYLELISQKNA